MNGRQPPLGPASSASTSGDPTASAGQPSLSPNFGPIPPVIPDHTLLRRIGGGSYGDVWLALNTLGTFRAVKVVRRAAFDDDRPYEREFAGLQKFEPISRTHEGFVDLLQVGRNDAEGWFYYVMELADEVEPRGEGQCPVISNYSPLTLSASIKLHGAQSIDACLRIAYTLTQALEVLHRHGLVHRDIKPSNIIFLEGVPKLADIGLVAVAKGMGQDRSFVGTEGFIPPEGPGTPAADLYSLGIVLYVLGTGKSHRDFPEPPDDLATRPNREREQWLEFSTVIYRAASADPRRRYGSAAAMLADLKLLSAGKSVKRRENNLRRLKLATVLAVVVVLAVSLSLVSKQLLLFRSPPTRNSLEELGTTNLLAREQFLQGILLSEKTMEAKARDCFRKATELDPNFARAHARLGRSLMYWDLVLAKGPKAAFAEAEAVIRHALKLDPKCSETWAALGRLRMIYGANFSEGERWLRRAIDLLPSDRASWGELSLCLAYRGKIDGAVEIARQALKADPTRLWPRLDLGQRLLWAREFEAAAACYRETINFFPEVSDAHLGLGEALELAGDSDGAAKAYLEWRRLRGDSEAELTGYQANYAREGLRAFWRKSYDEILTGKRPPLALKLMGTAEVCAAIGDNERAFSAIEGAFEHGWNLGWLRVNPHFESLRKDPRFGKFMARLDAMEAEAERKSGVVP